MCNGTLQKDDGIIRKVYVSTTILKYFIQNYIIKQF